MHTLVDRLSEYVAALTYDQLPPEVMHQAKRLLLELAARVWRLETLEDVGPILRMTIANC